MEGWLGQQSTSWRAGVEVVALDPSAPFASAIRRALPQATIVVDHWHLVRLANQVVTEVRQRAAREQLGRRGRTTDPAWAHRRLLLRAGDQLSAAGLRRLAGVLATDDPCNEIGAAWGVKELLRALLAARTRHDAAQRLYRFYDACLAAEMAETTRLAKDHRDLVAAHRAVPGHRDHHAGQHGVTTLHREEPPAVITVHGRRAGD